MKPKKHLGQNFLEDKSALKKIANALALRDGDTVVEIGPGHGELTQELRIKNKELRILAIEKDERLAEFLKSKFRRDANTEIIEGDILKLLPVLITNYKLPITNYKVIGNIPYYITGHLLRTISELDRKPERIVLTVQKEVAERLCAAPPKMNLLAASVQFWAKPEIVARIGRENFHPAPKVDSAVIQITPFAKTQMDPDIFYPFIGALFKQPRKTIINNLRLMAKNAAGKGGIERILAGLSVGPAARPQNLSISDIVNLARSMKSA